MTALQHASAEPIDAAGTWNDLFRVFGRIGLISFGGPAAQIALMHRTLVDERGWLSERDFLDALSFCMLLPGPEAMQLATYAGWRIKGVPGGLLSGLLFVLPGALVVLILASVYAWIGSVPVTEGIFLGVKAAVLIIVIEALLKVARRALRRRLHWVLAAAAFIGIFFLSLPFPLIVLAAALFGFMRPGPDTGEQRPGAVTVHWADTLGRTGFWLLLWMAPILLLGPLTGLPILTEVGLFFAKLAVVTFGGAYAVLAYMAQEVVIGHGWLSAGEMIDGLGLAETTPGPLILVTEFVGYLAGFREGGLALGLACAALTLWATFVPCFLWIFAGAPYLGWITAQPRLRGALSAISAAVVGVILNLSLWFALHVAFSTVERHDAGPLTLWVPDLASFDWRVAIIAACAAVLLLRLHKGLASVLLISGVLGLIGSLAF